MKFFILSALLASAFADVRAQPVVKNAWVRATVSRQKATSAFKQLISSESLARCATQAVTRVGIRSIECH